MVVNNMMSSETQDSIRLFTLHYLKLVSFPEELRAYVNHRRQADPSSAFVAGGLYTWWDDVIYPKHPEHADCFSSKQREALQAYDTLIRSFHRTDTNLNQPVLEFMETTTFNQLSKAAKKSYRTFFWFGIFPRKK